MPSPTAWSPQPDRRRAVSRERVFWAGVLIGVGGMAAVDEIVFHQLLRWHNFYDQATPAVGVLSDGILHAVELVALVCGFFLLAAARRDGRPRPKSMPWAGVLLGAGGFQLFDGIVDHKILGVHQVRYGVDLLPYDISWIASAVVLLLAGVVVGLAPGWLQRRHRTRA